MTWTLGELLGDKGIEVRRECPTGKTAFDSKPDAIAVLRRLPKGRTQMSVFRCGYCDLYHLGHRRGAIT